MDAPGGGPDAGSEVSYESVASEGGYEPANERGRDHMPRIISSSHCVEVFRRILWSDGVFCGRRPPEPEEKAKGDSDGKAEVDRLQPHDPLAGLPSRILRFDGAIEAWLEELPIPRDPDRLPRPYTSLNDAAAARPDLSVLKSGNRRATLWYFTLEFLQQLWPFFLRPDSGGMKFWESALLERGCTIEYTHVEVGQVNCPQKAGKPRTQWLKDLFRALQASKWCPDGEARALVLKRRLTHASMSIGDAVQIGKELWVAGLEGFVSIKEAVRLLPPSLDPENDDEEPVEPTPSKPSKKKAKNGKGESKGNGKSEGEKDSKGDDAKDGAGRNGRGRGRKGRGKGVAESGGTARAGPLKGAGPGKRADRRGLRAQLQAERERLQQRV